MRIKTKKIYRSNDYPPMGFFLPVVFTIFNKWDLNAERNLFYFSTILGKNSLFFFLDNSNIYLHCNGKWRGSKPETRSKGSFWPPITAHMLCLNRPFSLITELIFFYRTPNKACHYYLLPAPELRTLTFAWAILLVALCIQIFLSHLRKKDQPYKIY